MSNASVRTPLLVLITVAGIVMSPFFQTRVAAQAPLQVIASGLDNPRGLAFGPDGALYVVEAGRGGNSPSLCLPNAEAPAGPLRCYGPSGAVTKVTGGGIQQRVITGLPSLAIPSGDGATGPHDIDFGFGNAWITIGLGGTPSVRAPFVAAGVNLGTLVKATLPGGQGNRI